MDCWVGYSIRIPLEEDVKIVGNTYISQPVRFNITEYLFNNFVIDLGASSVIGGKKKYASFDSAIRYNFLISFKKEYIAPLKRL